MNFLSSTKLVVFLLLLFTISTITNLYAQDWKVQFPKPSDKDLRASHFFDENVGFVVGDGGVIAKSIDNGYTWENIESGTNLNLNDIVFKDDNIHGYICGDEGIILKTDDGGISWSVIETNNAKELRTLSLDEDYLWTCGKDATLLRINRANNEVTDFSFINGEGHHFDLLYFKGDTGFVSSGSAHPNNFTYLFRTLNGGDTFEDISPAGNDTYYKDISCINDSTYYVSGGVDQLDIIWGSLYKTTNTGTSWATIGSGAGAFDNPIIGVHFLDESRGYVMQSVCDFEWNEKSTDKKNRNKEMWQPSLFYTEDGGETWIEKASLYNEFDNWYYNDLNVVNDSTLFICSEVGMFLRSTNGGSNFETQMHYDDFKLKDFFIKEEEEIWTCGEDGIVLHTVNGGDNWEILEQFDNDYLYRVFFTDNYIGYLFSSNWLYKTLDAGISWIKYDFPIDLNSPYSNFINNNLGFLFRGNLLYKTLNGGESWVQLISNLDTPFYDLKFISEYVGWGIRDTEDGVKSVFYTVDGGSSWEDKLSGEYELNSGYNLVLNGNNVFSTGRNEYSSNERIINSYIYKYNIENTTWSEILLPGHHGNLSFYKLYFINEDIGYLVTDYNVYKTSNSGISWELTNNFDIKYGIYSNYDEKLAWQLTNPEDSIWFISKTTTGGGVGIEEDNNYELAIMNYELKQNYPNPFNPTTRINYELRITDYESAEIVVYNAMGQQVWSSNLSSLNPNTCTFDGSKFNSGIYYYSLIIDGKRIDSKKMILLK